MQSAYRKNHSTETALLKVTNDILMDMNSQHAVLLVLLDLSAAFATVDYSALLRRLQTSFGISGAPLDWFKCTCQQEANVFPFPAPSLTVFLLTGAFHKGPVLVPCCISSTLQSYEHHWTSPSKFSLLCGWFTKNICPSSPMTCQVNKIL